MHVTQKRFMEIVAGQNLVLESPRTCQRPFRTSESLQTANPVIMRVG
jgi:hypothetical protein